MSRSRARDEAREHRLLHRRARRAGRAEEEGDHDERPGALVSGQRQPGEPEGRKQADRVHGEQHRSPVVAVGEDTGERGDDERWQKGGEHHEADGARVVVQVERHPAARRERGHVGDARQDRRRPQRPKPRVLNGRENARPIFVRHDVGQHPRSRLDPLPLASGTRHHARKISPIRSVRQNPDAERSVRSELERAARALSPTLHFGRRVKP